MSDTRAGTTRIIRGRADGAAPRRRPARGGVRVLRSQQVDAQAEADRIIARAREEERAIAHRARADAAALRLQAVEEARAEAAALIVGARRQAQQAVTDATGGLTQLAVAIAHKLLCHELELHPDRIAQIVAQCLREAGAARRIVIRVNPTDVDAVQTALPLLSASAEVDLLSVQPDPDVVAGGCLLETEVGELDGRLETRLDLVLRALAPKASP